MIILINILNANGRMFVCYAFTPKLLSLKKSYTNEKLSVNDFVLLTGLKFQTLQTPRVLRSQVCGDYTKNQTHGLSQAPSSGESVSGIAYFFQVPNVHNLPFRGIQKKATYL